MIYKRYFALIALLLVIAPVFANQRPYLEVNDEYNAQEGTLMQFTVDAGDPDNDKVTISAMKLPRGATFDGREFQWYPEFDQEGTHYVKFIATDSKNLQSSKTVRLVVFDVNHRPIINMVSPDDKKNVTAKEGLTTIFIVSAADPDEDTLTYKWYLDEKLKKSGSSPVFQYKPDYDEEGFHTLRVVIKDREFSRERIWDINVENVNRAPKFTSIRDYEIKAGKLLRFSIDVEDPDDDFFLLRVLKGLPPGAGFDPVAGTITWTPDEGQEGYWPITFQARDIQNATTERTMKIIVYENHELEATKNLGEKLIENKKQSQTTPIIITTVVGKNVPIPGYEETVTQRIGTEQKTQNEAQKITQAEQTKTQTVIATGNLDVQPDVKGKGFFEELLIRFGRILL